MKKIIDSRIFIVCAAMLLFVVAWQIVGSAKLTFMIPPFTDIIEALGKLIASGKLVKIFIFSMQSLVEGLALAIFFGIILGVLTGRYSFIDNLTSMYIGAFMSSPMSAFIPILILLFGIGRASVVATVFMFSFFVTVINTKTGVRDVNHSLIEMAYSFGASERKLLWYIIIPGALPEIMTGIRLAVGRAYRGLIVGEMLISLMGLGGMLETYGNSFNVTYLYAVIFSVIAVAVIITEGIHVIDNKLIGWRRNSNMGIR